MFVFMKTYVKDTIGIVIFLISVTRLKKCWPTALLWNKIWTNGLVKYINPTISFVIDNF